MDIHGKTEQHDPASATVKSDAQHIASVTAASIPCTSAAFAELSAQILRSGKTLRFRASGGSMSPLVRDGDIVLVAPVAPSALRVGDVVLCSSAPGRIVVHRVVRWTTGPDSYHFTVQGDQVARPDGVMSEAQIHGRVVAIERGGTYIDMDARAMRALSSLTALRSRRRLGRGKWLAPARRLVRRLPFLSRYLS
jgi:signal peptidase I